MKKTLKVVDNATSADEIARYKGIARQHKGVVVNKLIEIGSIVTNADSTVDVREAMNCVQKHVDKFNNVMKKIEMLNQLNQK